MDDDLQILEILSDVLEQKGYALVSATDGQSAWEEFKRSKPDLVLTDLIMPGLNGMELFGLIRKEKLSTRVIFLTGYGTFKGAIEALRLGADDYLLKPIKFDDLLHNVQKVFCRTPLERENYRYRKIASFLAEENERLEREIAKLSERQQDRVAGKEADKYRAICGFVAHNMNGEFLHIGHSIKELRELAGMSPDIQEEYDMIERSVAYSQILLRRLLDYLDMGKAQQKLIDILELFRRIELLARPRLPSSIKLHITIDQSVKKQMVYANTEQLMGVLLELIDNAVNVLRKKGGTIELKLEGSNGEIGMSVRDDGPGIPVKLRKNLFKKQVSTKRGLGLGLFLCDKVVSALGGKLNLQTASGQGTTFTILLPTANDKKGC